MSRLFPGCYAFGRTLGDPGGQYGGAVAGDAAKGESGEPRAWIGRRIVGFSIDWIASSLIVLLLFPQFPYGSVQAWVPTAIVFIVEASVLTWLTGSSFGQRISGLGVAAIDGGRLPLWRALVRNFLICLVLPAVVYDNQGRGLHDRLAGTYVVKVR